MKTETAIASIASIAALSLLIGIMWSMGQQKPASANLIPVQPATDTRDVKLSPEDTHCIGQPYGTKQDGWSRLRTQDTDYVEALVKRGMAEYALPRPQTIKCRDVSKNPITDIYLRETWWRKKPRQNINRACGDYTRPDYGWPVVVGV